MLSDVIVAFDHLKHTTTVLANVDADETVDAGYERAVAAIREVRERLAGPLPAAGRAAAGAAGAAVELEHGARGVRGHGGADHGVRARGRRLPGRPVPALERATGLEPFSIYRGLRAVNPSPYMYFLDFEDFQLVGASPEPLVTVTGDRVDDPPDRRHAPARRLAGGRPAHRRGAAGRREGARRARDARRPRPQRPRARVRLRHGRGRDVHGRRDLLARHPHRLERRRPAAARRRPGRRAALRAPRGDAVRRAQGARDGDHRGARAGQARRLRRRGRLPLLHGRPRHLHLHPHGRLQGRRGPRAGGRRDGRRRQAGLRVRGVAAKARGVVRAIELAVRQPEWP